MRLIMFRSDDCPACHQMEQFLDEVCAKAKVTLTIADVTKRVDLVIKHQVSMLPTLVLEDQGEPVARVARGFTKHRFVKWLEEQGEKAKVRQ